MASYKAKLFIVFVITLLLVSGCNKDNKDDKAHNFEIYLVKDLSTTEAMSKDLNEIILENAPILTDKEIRIYNWKEHTFLLKESFSLEEKLEGKVPLSGKPFIVVTDNERIYLGSFWTPLSSLYIPEIPTIYSIWVKNNEKNSYSIQYSKQIKDPRNDKRIYKSLKALGKIDSN